MSSLASLGSSEQDQLRSWMQEMCRESLYFLVKAVLGRNKLVSPLHKEMCDHLQQRSFPKTLTLVPRGFYKTTIGAEGYPIWRLINDPNDTILIANATITNAQKFLRVIKHHIESNNMLRWLFPDLIPRPQDKWTEYEICVPRSNDVKESSVEAIGVGGTAVGRHFRCIIKDDLVNEDHLLSREQMQKVVDWHKYSASLLVHPGRDREHVQGTRWAFYDVYSHIMDNEPSFKVLKRGCVKEDGQPEFPEEFDLQTLADLRARQGTFIFSAQYENQPSDPERQVIMSSWLQYIEDLPQKPDYQRCNAFMLVDPAVSTQRHGDYTGIIVAYVDSRYDVYVELAERARMAPDTMIQRVMDLVQLYNPLVVGIETVSFGKALKYMFERAQQDRKKWFYIQELQPNTHVTKEMRIRSSLQPLFSQRKVYLGKRQVELVDELLKFPLGEHDDLIDALAYLPHVWMPGRKDLPVVDKPEDDPFNMAYILEKLHHGQSVPTMPFVWTPPHRVWRN